MYKNQKNSRTNCAFTLAEVLITLGIIGAVAALTMPTLMQNKNNNEIQAKVKKIYSTLTNVDINGAKEPNVTGRDLFSFAISPKDNVQILPFPKSACGETSPEKCSGQVIYGDLSYLNSFSNMKYDCYDNCAGSTQCNLVNK